MPNDKWSDEDIESLLRDFPKIQDKRPKDEVHKQLVQEKHTHKQPKRWLPLLVAIVAFLSITAVAVSLLQQSGMDSSSGGEPDSGDSQSMMTAEQADDGETAVEKSSVEDAAPGELAMRTAVYENDLANRQLLHIGLAYHGYVVPASFLLAEGQVDSTSMTSLNLYEQFASQIDEEELGFDDYHPYSGYFEQGESRLSHFLPDDHVYDQGSASTLLYLNSLKETFRDQPEIHILDERGNAAELAHLGTAQPLIPDGQGHSYYALANNTGEWYLAPAYGLSETSAEQALIALKEAPNDDYHSPIPSKVSYAVEQRSDSLVIAFDEPLDLEALNGEEAMRMIESMALTAKSYGESLEFSNVVQSNWGGFDFTGELELPVAPNRLDWPEK